MILLTGSSGRAGSFLLEQLLDQGWAVRTADSRGRADLQGDLLDAEFCERCVQGVTAVVHAAARPDPSYTDTFENNTLSTWNLAQAARAAGVQRFLFISSICAAGLAGFGSRGFIAPDRLPVDGRVPDRPHEPYGLSKQVCEVQLEGLARNGGMATYCLRACALWDPQMTRDFRPGPRPPRAGQNLVDPWHYLDMRDLAAAVHLALRADLRAFGSAYLTAPDTTRPEPSLLLLAYYFPKLLWRIRGNLWGHRGWFDCSQAYQDLGWKPRHSWRLGVTKKTSGG